MKSLTLSLNKSKTTQETINLLTQGWETYRKNAVIYSLYTLLASSLMWVLSSIPFASSLIFPFYMAGLYTAIKAAEGKNILTLHDFLNINKESFNLIFTAGTLSSLLTFVGFLALIVPGAYAFCAYAFVIPFSIEEENANLKAWNILERSRTILHENTKQVCSMMACYFLITLLALLPLGLGLFVSVPFIACVNYRLYKKVK